MIKDSGRGAGVHIGVYANAFPHSTANEISRSDGILLEGGLCQLPTSSFLNWVCALPCTDPLAQKKTNFPTGSR